MRKEHIYSILDGVITGLSLYLIWEYAFSAILIEPIEYNIIILSIFCIIPVSSLYFLIFRKAERPICEKYLISFASFMVIQVINFINIMTLNIKLFPRRETSDADGLLAMFFMGSYVAFVLISRLLAFIINYIIKKRE